MSHGEVGDVVVSNLVNRATVLLNYRVGDRAVADPRPCPCGRSLPLLARLEGRRGETIDAAGGLGLSQLGLEFAFWAELQHTLLYQVARSAPDAFTWRIVPMAGADRDALRATLAARCRELFGEGVRAEVEFVEDVARTANGKVRRVLPLPHADRSAAPPGGR
jgi:phenylacetate-CoA ligase